MNEYPEITDADIHRASRLLDLPVTAFYGHDGLDPRQAVLKSMAPMDVAACPGSGKTTLLVAKLAILAEKWMYRTRGICVLSHTNAARSEIETRLGNTSIGRRLLSYPHYIGTIHGFVDDFLALPWLRALGYPIRMIDTEICERRRWNKLQHKWQFALQRKHVDESNIRIADASFNVARKDGPFPFGDQTDTYKRVREVCEQTALEGYHCYDDMFVWAHDMITRIPAVPRVVRDRFPLLLIDEAQDNSEEQSRILHRIFMEGRTATTRQRFGDGNQAIFDSIKDKAAATDGFPDNSIKKDLPNSHRFGQGIADLADPLGLSPYGLKGQGPKKPLASGATEGQHTIFLFDDTNAVNILDAYGALLVETFSSRELMSGTFAAVGQIHRRPDVEESQKFPHHVSHYWASYDPELGTRDLRPRTFVQCVLVGLARAVRFGEAHAAVETMADGILRLSAMTTEQKASPPRRHKHRHVLSLLDQNPAVRADYEDFIARFAVNGECLTQEAWGSQWSAMVKKISETIAGEALANPQAAAFLIWPETPVSDPAHESVNKNRDNIYTYPLIDPKVSIRVGSIHSVKGQTHTATLLLETFWYGSKGRHNLELILPWLCGIKSGGVCEGVQQQARLKLHYVAMTRPTHLLCLAMKRSTFSNGGDGLDMDAIQGMERRGWTVKVI